MPHTTFNLAQVAEYLHVAKDDVEELARKGDIPCEQTGGRLVFRRKEIDAWASRRILGFDASHLAAYHRRSSSRCQPLSEAQGLIPQLMQKDFIVSHLNSRTKASVLRDMVDLADRTGLVNDAKGLLDSLLAREQQGTTALAGGLALLHPSHHEPYMFERSFLLLGRTVQELPFGSPDGRTTDLFFLLCCQDDRLHLHALARICMIAYRSDALLRLREAEGPDAMFEILAGHERDLLASLRA